MGEALPSPENELPEADQKKVETCFLAPGGGSASSPPVFGSVDCSVPDRCPSLEKHLLSHTDLSSHEHQSSPVLTDSVLGSGRDSGVDSAQDWSR